eukprot:TRINITY_DN2220_c0_g1_i10.p1 TRINITY_DN2220_c0_g1~~TRINITY_DN2220_c0_g1_i10.p1  ORF type:complete len:237 (+),score=60.02 TRINITY_DN2220_c0_g1_i10:110-820(+)
MSRDDGSVVSADWVQLYEHCSSIAREVEADLREKDRAKGGNTAKLQRQIRQKMSQLTEDVDKLDRALSKMERKPMDYKIGEGEANRRRGILTQLKSTVKNLERQVTGGNSGPAYEEDSRKPRKYEETDRTRDVSNQQLLAQQQQVLEAQDRQLDDILHGVKRLNHLGQDINAELDLHHNLLAEIDHGVDVTQAKIQANTKRVEQVEEQSGGCLGMCIIFFLIGVILLLLLVPGKNS